MRGRRAPATVRATSAERARTLPGDEIVPEPDSVMDRGFDVPAAPEQVWPWLVQLGKRRAGWYLPRTVERLVPRGRRAARAIDPRWQRLAVGDVIPDYGGRDETFEAVTVEAPHTLVYRSRRGRMQVSWAMVLTRLPADRTRTSSSRVHLRLRLGPVKHIWLADTAGVLVDLVTIAGLAAGLAERVRESSGADPAR